MRTICPYIQLETIARGGEHRQVHLSAGIIEEDLPAVVAPGVGVRCGSSDNVHLS